MRGESVGVGVGEGEGEGEGVGEGEGEGEGASPLSVSTQRPRLASRLSIAALARLRSTNSEMRQGLVVQGEGEGDR